MSDLQIHGSDSSAGYIANPEAGLQRYEQRLESLLEAFLPDAVAGELKSAELCRRVLQQQAELYGLGGKVTVSAPSDEGDDELAKLRARRAGA